MIRGLKLGLCLAVAAVVVFASGIAAGGAGSAPYCTPTRDQSVQIDASGGLAMAGLWNYIDAGFHESQGGGWGMFWFPFYLDYFNEWWSIVIYDYTQAAYSHVYYLFPDNL